MEYYCYLVHNPDGTLLHLSDEGVREEGPEFAEKLKRKGYHHEEERPMGGGHVLRVYKKKMPATDIVPEDE